MTHPLKWYSIHVAKTGRLRNYAGEEIGSLGDFTKLTRETFRKHGVIGGFKSMIFEKIFPLFAISQLPKTIEFWRSRWKRMEAELVDAINGKKKFNVVEIGCGSGDLLITGARFAKKKGVNFGGIGIDIDPEAIRFARGYSKALGFSELNFFVGDAIKGTVEGSSHVELNELVKETFKGRADLVVVEGVIEWLRPFQDQLLETLFSLDAKEYVILAASSKAINTKGGKIITSIARLSGEKVRGFTLNEFEELLKQYAGDRTVSVKVCGGDWYPEAFYIARIR